MTKFAVSFESQGTEKIELFFQETDNSINNKSTVICTTRGELNIATTLSRTQ